LELGVGVTIRKFVGGKFVEISSNLVPRKEITLRKVFY
jgi:hypothetical protein